ncbi:D-aminoacyl-tRNA deacylase [Myxococcota bacterium]|nr:D-aminoacyl-tRNA deacylase [Myxococcota bacterium]
MRAVLQRVSAASVDVGGESVFGMDEGLLALVGVASEDTPTDARDLARRMVNLRIFADDRGQMNRSLLEVGGTLGVVSQFTLLADARRGRRPSFGSAASSERAEPLLVALVEAAELEGVRVVAGQFGADMKVSLVNDGPVTLLLDTQKLF